VTTQAPPLRQSRDTFAVGGVRADIMTTICLETEHNAVNVGTTKYSQQYDLNGGDIGLRSEKPNALARLLLWYLIIPHRCLRE
jgi:hypothetical protein